MADTLVKLRRLTPLVFTTHLRTTNLWLREEQTTTKLLRTIWRWTSLPWEEFKVSC